jgi:hypothetical protein
MAYVAPGAALWPDPVVATTRFGSAAGQTPVTVAVFVSVQVAGLLVVSVVPEAPVTLAVAVMVQVPAIELAVTSVEATPEEFVVALAGDGVPDGPEEGGVKVTVAPAATMVAPEDDVHVTLAWSGFANAVETGVNWFEPEVAAI